MWLWWILLFIGGALTIPGRIKGLKARVYRKWYSWIFIALSVATLAGFAFGHALVPIVKDRLSDAPLLPGIAYLFLIDWASITIFQWFLLVSSGMTIFALFWANALAVDDGVEELGPKVDRGLTRIKLFLDAKTFFGLITILMTMAYVLLLWNKTSGRFSVSPWAFGYLDWIYGNYAGALIR